MQIQNQNASTTPVSPQSWGELCAIDNINIISKLFQSSSLVWIKKNFMILCTDLRRVVPHSKDHNLSVQIVKCSFEKVSEGADDSYRISFFPEIQIVPV